MNIKTHKNIILFGNRNGLIVFGVLLVFLKKIYDFKLSIRPFGGGWVNYRNYNVIVIYLLRYVFKKCDFLYFQTKAESKYFKGLNSNTRHLPNGRVFTEAIINEKIKSKNLKLAYIGRITKSKGIGIIIELSKMIKKDDNIEIDVYGSIDYGSYAEEDLNGNHISYRGVLPYNEVMHTVNKYDYLLLPTLFKGEGYPGIILEALIQGVPVITSDLNEIKEIVNDGYNGFIRKPDPDEYYFCLKNHSKDKHHLMKHNAKVSSRSFDIKLIGNKFIADQNSLV